MKDPKAVIGEILPKIAEWLRSFPIALEERPEEAEKELDKLGDHVWDIQEQIHIMNEEIYKHDDEELERTGG